MACVVMMAIGALGLMMMIITLAGSLSGFFRAQYTVAAFLLGTSVFASLLAAGLLIYRKATGNAGRNLEEEF